MLGLLVLVPLLGGCDLESTEVGSTAGVLGGPTGGDASDSGGSSDTGAVFGSMDCEEGDIPIITGTVHRELGDHTWNESFEPAPDAFVYLRHTSTSESWPYALGENLIPFEGLPFDFAFCISEKSMFEFHDAVDYDFSVYVFNHDTSELRVGDLLDQYLYTVDQPTYGLQIAVAGVEHCDAPYADEQCSTVE